MNAETVLLISLVVVVVALPVLLPLQRHREKLPPQIRERKSELRRDLREQKASLILAMREIDFDYELGKLSADDYKAMRERYQARTVDVMKRLDTLDTEWKETQKKVDAELAKRLGKPSGAVVQGLGAKNCTQCGTALVANAKFCAQCGTPQAISCRSCGKALNAGDRFCSGCGQASESRAYA